MEGEEKGRKEREGVRKMRGKDRDRERNILVLNTTSPRAFYMLVMHARPAGPRQPPFWTARRQRPLNSPTAPKHPPVVELF